jgi:hypothetical protein
MDKANYRLYFNITNKCNTMCPFCCVFSGPEKNTFLSFDIFKSNVDYICSLNKIFELRLEGGEPLLHPDFYLFMEYARHTERCDKIIIATNGIVLMKHLNRIIDFVKNYNIPVRLVHSINYHLYSRDNKLFKKCRDIFTATEFVENFEMRFNVRLRKEDDWLVQGLKDHKLFDHSYIYNLQKYGRWDVEGYEIPFIKQNIDDWAIFSPDGRCFGQNLVGRSEHERNLL